MLHAKIDVYLERDYLIAKITFLAKLQGDFAPFPNTW